jgi:cyclopropane fatty-acyl-phospholipid synthase-like methyltransferase
MIKKKLGRLKFSFERLFLSDVEKRHELVGPPKLWKMKQDFQINFLHNRDLKKTDTLLDIGCGTLRGGIPIIDFLDSGNYCGIEVRENVLAEGKKELKEHKLEHKNPILVSFNDFKDLDLESKFDIAFAFSVLIHLEDHITAGCLKFVSKHLSKDGIFYANVNIGNQKDGNWQGFPVANRSLEFYKDLCESNGLSLKVIGTIGEFGHNSGIKAQDDQPMLEIKLA